VRLLYGCISALLSTGWKLGAKSSRSNHTDLLRSLLRRFPYWAEGHIIFAEEALSNDEVAEAYASANAALYLGESNPRTRALAEFTLGRCFLRRGDWRSAVEYLSRSKTALPDNHAVTEELAAARILGGDFTAARSLLEAIPSNHISAAGKAALSFTRAKNSTQS